MRKIDLSGKHCTYIIATGPSIDALEKNVNDIIARGWETDGALSGRWTLVGGVGHDKDGYFQAMMNCPPENNSTGLY